MRILVIGCGRVGSALAARLVAEGHDVHVIDRNAKARRLLPSAFDGEFIVGNGYSRLRLEGAGIEHADALIAVTSGDNSNIVAARIAKEVYRVPVVIARIYDPRRAEIYRDLGIPTVASVRWTVGRVYEMLLHRHLAVAHSFGSGETQLVSSALPPYMTGRPFNDLEIDGSIRVVEVTRAGRSFIPERNALAQERDLVTFAVSADALGQLRGILDKELGT
jgi:trk system potassium uptake protein TrkA